MNKPFRTLRGFLAGKEREEDTYFAYSASLRIAGEISDMDKISATLGLSPTHSHRKGERRGAKAVPYRQDMWSYSPPVEKSEPLHSHIDALWLKLKPSTSKHTVPADNLSGKGVCNSSEHPD